jgi:murein DD-endopeptidase MepM/ murein hydrolase activator NlpD
MKAPALRSVAAALALALAACAPEFNPPPDYRGGFLWDTARSRTVTVAKGDTLYDIARRYDVPIRLIAARNGLQPPYALTIGQMLILDPPRIHRIAAGETLDSIAARYGVPRAAIADVNELRAPYQLAVGQDVWIPDPFTVAAAQPTPRAATPAPAVPREAPRPQSPPIVTSSLPPPPGAAALPGSPGAPKVESVPLKTPEGEPVPVVINPPQPDSVALANRQAAAAALPDARPVPPAPLPRPPAVTDLPPQSAAPPAPPAEAVAAIAPAPVPPAVPTFVWPVKGRVISGFGPAGKGLHNDGINIAAPLGTQVRAAEGGVVAYAGSELKGFGNLLLIKHDNGLTTAYAHNDKLLVARGDVVRQGQVIATVGKSGGIDAPQLHFEVRRGTQAVDPQGYLKR